MEKLTSIEKLEGFRNKILNGSAEGRTIVQVCMTGCRAYGAASVKEALEEEVKKQGMDQLKGLF